VPVLLRYVLYILLCVAAACGLLWLLWQLVQWLADVIAAVLFVVALAVTGPDPLG
jgi:membrane glycosyltransferase